MSNTWRPQRTLAEVEAILCAPGSPNELETRLIDGRIQRVYKNQWPSARIFWLWATDLYANKPYIVYENQRYTYKEVLDRSVKAAAIFSDVYGDRVGICSRNYPEYLVAFWACHLIGAVAVLTNAWLPIGTLVHCLVHTQCKLIFMDSERADRLEPEIKRLTSQAGATGVVVLESHEGKGHWKGMKSWETVFRNYKGDLRKVLQNDPKIEPEDNCLIIFTSGTTGLPSNAHSSWPAIVAGRRALLRRGEHIPPPSPDDPQQGILIAVPFFHVTLSATLGGAKIVLIRKWNPKEAARLIRQEKLTTTGGVPSMSSDLIESELKGYPLAVMSHGGAVSPSALTTRARAAFPDVMLAQGYSSSHKLRQTNELFGRYGLTETNSIAVSFAGEDYDTRPTSCGLASPVNDILIMKDGKALPSGEIGEIWIRGPNIMQEYWRDPAATDKVLTKDGWLSSGDIGLQDEEGFIYIRDRIKDIIIRGGENIDSTTVENALFTDGVMEVAAVAVPDEKLGELVSAVVSVRPGYEITEESLVALARTRLPSFAVPVMVLFQPELPHNQSGKILKADLRKFARSEWEKRGRKAVAKL
ncbi:hypothetical protein B0H19DRAFT_1178324 [Mycena capillaripes]|nr:hypothetical protein B0H19DRAFT_1178324 [Mycena capillaripes]